MVKLRLTRIGTKHAPFYRIVAIDERRARSGKALDIIGTYDPTKTNDSAEYLNINTEKALKWLECGAQPTDTVKDLLRKKDIKINK